MNIAQALPTIIGGWGARQTVAQWATAAVGPGGIRGAWGRGPPEAQWATVAAPVGPGAACRVPAKFTN